MVDIRRYRTGDIDNIRRTAEFEQDYYLNGARILNLLEHGDSWTFISGQRIVACANAEYMYNGWYELFATYQADITTGEILAMKRHLDGVMPRYRNVYTVSVSSKRNDRLHRLFGFNLIETIKGYNIWERQHKIL